MAHPARHNIIKPFRGQLLNLIHPLSTRTILNFPMNEGSRNTIYDISGNNYSATYSDLAGFDWVSGLHGWAIDKDGVNGSGFITDATVQHGIGTGDFAIVAWVKPEQVVSAYRGICANGAFSPALYTRLSGGESNWGIYWGGDRASGNDLVANTWYHLVATRRAGTIFMYQGGVQTPTTHALGTSMADATFKVGWSGSGSEVLDGLIENVIFYNRGLSEEEIRLLFSMSFINFN